MNASRTTCVMNLLTVPTLKGHTLVNVKRVTQETDRSALKVGLRLKEHDFHLRSSSLTEPWTVRIP